MTDTDTKIAEILQDFEIFDGVYKREHVEAAIELKEEITPHLIEILEDVLADPTKYIDNRDYFAHVYAFILLGHFKEHRAHNLVVDLFSVPEGVIEPLFSDSITVDLPIVLFRTCAGSIELIKSLVLNKEAYDFCRIAALNALVFAAVDGMTPREEVLEFFGSLFTGDETASHSDFWGLLACYVRDLYPEELMDVIAQAYEDGLIAPGLVGYESFEKILAEGKERTLKRTRENMQRQSLDNVHDHMSWWACFQPEKKTTPQKSAKIASTTQSSPVEKSPMSSTSFPTPPEKKSPTKKRTGKRLKKKKRRIAKSSRKKNRRR